MPTATLAVTSPAVNPEEAGTNTNAAERERKNRLAQIRRVARRHSMRIVTSRQADECRYEVQAAVTVTELLNIDGLMQLFSKLESGFAGENAMSKNTSESQCVALRASN